MSSNLKVNTILPSAGTAIGIGTDGGTLSLTGSVGIGTSTHNGVFHIQHNVGNSTNYYLNDGNTVHIKNTHADGYASLRLMGGGTGSDNNAIVWGGQGSESLVFSNRQNERVRILADGKVRIAGVSTLTNIGQTLQLLDNDSTDAIGTKATLGLLGYVDGTARTLAAVGARKNTAGGNFAGDLSFFTRRNNQSLLDERARITSAGDLNVLAGNLIIGTNNKGISFSGSSSSPDTDSTSSTRVMTDYDEGTCNWELHRSDGLTTGSNHTSSKVTYTKIGNRVFMSGYVYTASTGSSTSGITAILTDASGNAASLPYTPNHSGILPICHTRTIDEYERMSVSFEADSKTAYVHRDEAYNSYQPSSNNVNISSSQTHLLIAFTGSYTTDE